MMKVDLKGKISLVTGAAQGMGKAIAEAFAANGSKVIFADIDYEKVKENAAKLNGCMAVKMDVTNTNMVFDAVDKAVKQMGAIDILVNNAGGMGGLCPFPEMSPEHWDKVINLNMRSAFLCARAVVKGMIEKGSGVIINVSSVIAHAGGATGEVAYSAAKGGASALTRGLAKELCQYGIRVNTIAPGATDTAFLEAFDRKKIEEFIPRIPLKRLGQPEDIANAALYLASEASSFMTGQSLEVNGGFWVG